MACSKYMSTSEKTHAARVSRLLVDPCTDLFRDLLRSRVSEIQFPSKLENKKKVLNCILNKVQRDLFYPSLGSFLGTYNDFDLSLLYVLLRNVADISPHKKGWGKQPDPSDCSVSANIDRVRDIRNVYCGHAASVSLSDPEFHKIWQDLTIIIGELEGSLPERCTTYTDAANQIKIDTMDPEQEKKYLDIIDEQHQSIVYLKGRIEENTEEASRLDGRIEETLERVEKLDDEMEKLTKSPIPTNVRGQYDIDIQKWREEDKLYYETHSFPSVMQKVRNQTYITFVGVSGSGKSATAHHIALKLQEEGYEVVPTKDVRKLEDYGDPRNPQVFVIDDVVGVFGLQKTNLNVLTNYEQTIRQPCMVKSKTLMTCREAVFNETLPYKPFFTKEETVINLRSSDNALDNNDKKQILQKYGLNVDLMSPALLTSTSRKFPLLCKLFSNEKKFQALGAKFFLNPVQCIIDELDDMQIHNKLNYSTLVLCMLYKNSISEAILKDMKNEQLIETLGNCKLQSQTDAIRFMDALSAMEGTYTKQCGEKYTFIHDSMFEICAYQYGKQFPDQMLMYMSSSYIANYVKPEASKPGIANEIKEDQGDPQYIQENNSSRDSDEKGKVNDDKNNEREKSFDLCIRLSEDQYPLLAERLYRDIQNMKLYDVFRNQVLKHPQVCQAFIGVLETKSYAELKSLFLSKQGDVDKIVSKQKTVARQGEEKGERMRQEVLVDQRYKLDDKGNKVKNEYLYNVRVVSWVIYYGHSQIIQYIIKQTQQYKENGELFRITENTPHQSTSWISKNIMKIMNVISNRKQKKVEQYRLLVLGCFSGDVHTVRVLLPVCKEAIIGIDQISKDTDWYHLSPLTVACMDGHAGVVKELVKAGVDVNLHIRRINKPLITACERGHVCVVKELVKNGVDVNLHDSRNIPLMIACKEGHVSIVEELIKAGADVNLLDEWGNPPLVTAVRNCPLSAIKSLVEHGADLITDLVDIDLSAVNTGLILDKPDIVKYLIQYQNEINPGKFNGNAHLFNCLVELRHARVKTDSKDDVFVTDRSVWCMDDEGDWWKTIRWGNCDALIHLLCMGLDVNQRIQLYERYSDRMSDVRPLLYTLIDELEYVSYRAEKVRILLEAGADINVRVRLIKYDIRYLMENITCRGHDYLWNFLSTSEVASEFDREAVSALERVRRRVRKYSKNGGSINCSKRKEMDERVMCEIQKHVRRHSV